MRLLLPFLPGLLFAQVLEWEYFYCDSSGNSAKNEAYKLLYDGEKGIYVLGGTNSDGILVVKLDTAGNEVWVWHTDTGVPWITDMLLDGEGHLYLSTEGLTVFKMDTAGNLLWNRSFDPPSQGPTFIAKGNLGELYVGSRSNNLLSVWRFDTSGNLSWFNTYSPWGPSAQKATGISVDNGAGVLVGGIADDTAMGCQVGIVLKLDTAGNMLWYHAQRGYSYLLGRHDFTTDSTSCVYASVSHNAPPDAPATFYKLDTLGDSVWTFLSWTPLWDDDLKYAWLNDVIVNQNGIYYCGSSNPGGEFYRVFSVYAIGYDGTPLWGWKFGNNQQFSEAYDIISGQDGALFAVGYTKGDFYHPASQFPVVVNVTSSGDTDWTYIYTRPETLSAVIRYGREFMSIAVDTTGGIYAAGRWNNDLLVVKLRDTLMAVSEDRPERPGQSMVLVPEKNGFLITGYSGPAQIYDPAGRLILKKEINGKTLISPLRPGVYFVVVGKQRARVAVR